MDFATGFATGWAMGKKMFEGGGGEPEEDWTPPSDWPDIPEPSDYEMFFLIDVSAVPQTFSFTATNPTDATSGVGALSIDWGDGSTSDFTDNEWRTSDCTHEYNATGKYVVKVSASATSCFLQQIKARDSNGQSILLMAKLGSEIILDNGSYSHTQEAFREHCHLRYVKFGGKGGLPNSNAFFGDFALCKVDITIPPTIIPSGTFNYTYSLKKFDFSEVVLVYGYGVYFSGFEEICMPKCKTVGDHGVHYNNSLKRVDLPLCTSIESGGLCQNQSLKDISLPSCTNIGRDGMDSDYALKRITIAEGCIFGKNCFAHCYSLSPHPDGSTDYPIP